MPKIVARLLAEDPNVGTTELKAAVEYLTQKIKDAAENGDPAPFISYRNRSIMKNTIHLRHED